MKSSLTNGRRNSAVTKQKMQSRQAKYQALSWLKRRFPKAFDIEMNIYPLQIGIMTEILKHAEEAKLEGISKAKLREAVVIFTRGLDYLACLKTQSQRINLEGDVVGQVTFEEAERAALKIKKWVEKTMRAQKKFHEEQSRVGGGDMDARRFESEKERSSKKIEIVFKTKNPKVVDPEAVQRLKSKLGLAQKENPVETS